jgi:hypothetical protein
VGLYHGVVSLSIIKDAVIAARGWDVVLTPLKGLGGQRCEYVSPPLEHFTVKRRERLAPFLRVGLGSGVGSGGGCGEVFGLVGDAFWITGKDKEFDGVSGGARAFSKQVIELGFLVADHF